MAYLFAPVKSRLDGEAAKKLYDKGKSDLQIACSCGVSEKTVRRWRETNRLKLKRPKEHEEYLSDVERCKKCAYWYGANGERNVMCFCNYLLTTGKRRVQENGVCLSFAKETRVRK